MIVQKVERLDPICVGEVRGMSAADLVRPLSGVVAAKSVIRKVRVDGEVFHSISGEEGGRQGKGVARGSSGTI